MVFIKICNICIINYKKFLPFLTIYCMIQKYKTLRKNSLKDFRKGPKNMKKTLLIFTVFLVMIGVFFATTQIYAENKAIDEATESKII